MTCRVHFWVLVSYLTIKGKIQRPLTSTATHAETFPAPSGTFPAAVSVPDLVLTRDAVLLQVIFVNSKLGNFSPHPQHLLSTCVSEAKHSKTIPNTPSLLSNGNAHARCTPPCYGGGEPSASGGWDTMWHVFSSPSNKGWFLETVSTPSFFRYPCNF